MTVDYKKIFFVRFKFGPCSVFMPRLALFFSENRVLKKLLLFLMNVLKLELCTIYCPIIVTLNDYFQNEEETVNMLLILYFFSCVFRNVIGLTNMGRLYGSMPAQPKTQKGTFSRGTKIDKYDCFSPEIR